MGARVLVSFCVSLHFLLPFFEVVLALLCDLAGQRTSVFLCGLPSLL